MYTEEARSMAENGEGGALKGLRQLTLERGPEGFGFHMYTNRHLKGQFIKTVFPNGPADLAGMLSGDHVLAVDEYDVIQESHHQVVERIRAGDGKTKKLLVIDLQTEKEMAEREEKIDPANALVMIPRTATKLPEPEAGKGEDYTDAGGPLPLTLGSMADALPKSNKRQKIKTRDWKSSVQAYNDL